MRKLSALVFGATTVLVMLSCGAGRAQEFPNRPISIIVPYAAGGVTDQITRIVSDSASQILGQSIIVDNRAGGGGQIAANAVKNAAPDGYTLLLADIGTHAINKSMFRKLSYDPVKDFVPVAEIGESPQVLVVPSSSPYRSLADIVKAARERPGTIRFASPGLGSGSQLQGEILASSQKIELVHVPYRGSSAIMPDLITGRIDLFFGAATSALPFIGEGSLRPIAAADPKRIPQLPDLPTVAELGIPELSLPLWVGVLAPAATSDSIVQTLHAAFLRALATPKVKERFDAIVLNVPPARAPADFARFMQAETERLAPIIRQAGIVME
jgi:tripartite-type tricarboxylate transporter receptor subunit TctC